jgi:hypothetical protein
MGAEKGIIVSINDMGGNGPYRSLEVQVREDGKERGVFDFSVNTPPKEIAHFLRTTGQMFKDEHGDYITGELYINASKVVPGADD